MEEISGSSSAVSEISGPSSAVSEEPAIKTETKKPRGRGRPAVAAQVQPHLSKNYFFITMYGTYFVQKLYEARYLFSHSWFMESISQGPSWQSHFNFISDWSGMKKNDTSEFYSQRSQWRARIKKNLEFWNNLPFFCRNFESWQCFVEKEKNRWSCVEWVFQIRNL